MTFKSFPSAAAIVSACWLAASFAASPSLVAQTPSPSPSPATSKLKNGYIRFLNAMPLGSGNFDLVSGDSRTLQTASPSNFFFSYASQPPSTYTLRVFHAGDRKSPIKSFNVPLRADTYFTILAHLQPDGQPTIELIDDTPDPKASPANRLTVHQYCREARVVVTAGRDQQHTDALNFGDSQIIANLPDGTVPLTVRSILVAGGAARIWNTEANFRAARHASLFIVTDPYGRIRPRVTADGPSPTDEDATAAATAATP